jgi:hydroxypyruvate reductase
MISIAPSLRESAYDIFHRALTECSIERAFSRKLKILPGKPGRDLLLIGDQVIDFSHVKRVRIVAVGKAGAAMLQCVLPYLQGRSDCEIAGVLIAKEEPSSLPSGFRFFPGGHPFPNQASVDGARAALALVRSIREESAGADGALCLFLISGGASAMMELPLDPAISLTDTIAFHRELVHSGASIAEINCVRKHFSAVKGGRLAMAVGGVPCLSLLVSDVPAGHLDALASGPTLPDTSTLAQCREILSRHSLLPRFPASVQRFFESADLQETPKPADLTSRAITLLDADDMAESARKRAEELGFHTVVDNSCDDWDYRAAAEYLLNRLRQLRPDHLRTCILSSGELTVGLPGPDTGSNSSSSNLIPGVGGRNQHFALYSATLLDRADASTVIFSAGSDGIDGNSKAAGGIVDEQTLMSDGQSTAHEPSLLEDAREALRRFDSGTFLERVDATVVTGATGNNLRDLRIILAESRS